MPKTTLIDCCIKKYAYREVSQIYQELEISEEGLSQSQVEFLLYTVRQVALFVFRISLFHSDRLSGHRIHIFHRVPAFLPVSLRFSDVSGHNPVVVLNSVFYLDIPRS